MILNTPFSGQRAESNPNVPYLIPLSRSVIRFSQHSWWTEWNSSIPAKVFHTHKAQWNSDVVSKCGAEPPLTSDSECIIILCACVALLPTVWSVLFPPDDLWHVAWPVLTLQSQPGHKLSVCWCGARIWLVTCQQSTTTGCFVVY